MEPMLKVTDLSVSYGHVEALRGVSIQVEQGADRLHHRRERRRQVHYAEDRLRPFALQHRFY